MCEKFNGGRVVVKVKMKGLSGRSKGKGESGGERERGK